MRRRGPAGARAAGSAASGGFDAVRAEARGQTVRWWLYGGDARVNAFVEDAVVPAARRLGVTLDRVPVTDTADAVSGVVAERRAGKDAGGGVDLIWINGENFAAGKEQGLWLEDWAGELPSARFLDPADPAVATDFQVPVDGQESPWQSARFVFAHDTARLRRPPGDLDALLAWARRNPGRFTYPAPPDYTGSAFVRQVVQAKGEDAAFAYLRALKPLQWRGGAALPKSQAELDELFSGGQVDIAMSYDASFVAAGVRTGAFPPTARPFVLGGTTLSNSSFVTIPANARSRAGAQLVADLLLSPELQAAKADPEVLGNPTVLDLDRLGARARVFEDAARSDYVLTDFGRPLAELPAADVAPLEERWMREVLR
jgi:putative spermidine/putrescine transport system substrate-binding protein